MKPSTMLFVALALFSFPNPVISAENAGATIVAGKGCGKICLGASRSEVEQILGKGEFTPRFDGVFLLDYKPLGIRISFSGPDPKVRILYFYNKQKGFEQFAVFKGKTSNDLDWSSTAAQVLEACGNPIGDFSGKNSSGEWRRLAFTGVDFTFEDGRMVRICVPGTHQAKKEFKIKIKKSHSHPKPAGEPDAGGVSS